MKRREFLNKTALTVAGLSISSYAFSNLLIEEFITSETNFGKIKGYRENGVNIFKGVPYAGKTSGERRAYWRGAR